MRVEIKVTVPKKIIMVILFKLQTSLMVRIQKVFVKNLVVRVHKQSEKEQWYDHFPRRNLVIQFLLLPCTHHAPTLMYKELYFSSYPLVLLQWQYTDTKGKCVYCKLAFCLTFHTIFLRGKRLYKLN